MNLDELAKHLNIEENTRLCELGARSTNRDPKSCVCGLQDLRFCDAYPQQWPNNWYRQVLAATGATSASTSTAAATFSAFASAATTSAFGVIAASAAGT